MDALANKQTFGSLLEKKNHGFVPAYEDNEEFIGVSCASNLTLDGCLLRLAVSLASSAIQGCAVCNRNCNVSFNSLCLHVQALTDLLLFTMTSQRTSLPTIGVWNNNSLPLYVYLLAITSRPINLMRAAISYMYWWLTLR